MYTDTYARTHNFTLHLHSLHSIGKSRTFPKWRQGVVLTQIHIESERVREGAQVVQFFYIKNKKN